MQFLIDLENVHSAGLRGTEFLTDKDTLVLFYRDGNERIEQGALNRIVQSGCKMELRKLKTKGKNALDFYIAAYVGELLGKGTEEHVSIVSGDKDFQMIREYWSALRPQSMIALKPNIISCIVSSQEGGKRAGLARNEIKTVSLEEAYASITEKERKKKEIEEMIGCEKAEDALELLQKDTKGRELYLSLLRLLGREKGLLFYRYVKEKNSVKQASGQDEKCTLGS